MKFKICLLFLFSIFYIQVVFATDTVTNNVIYELDFSKAAGSVETWFKNKGWEFKENIKDMNPRFENGGLVIESKDDDLGVIYTEFKTPLSAKRPKLKVTWGVNQYPEGSQWEEKPKKTRNTRESISVIIYFGTERFSSGTWYVPLKTPYFLSFFLSDVAKPNKPYEGNYWKETGRYFCIPCTQKLNETIVTEVDLSTYFEQEFKKPMPNITAMVIEVDVKDTKKKNGRHSKAFIQNIQITKN